MGEWNADTDRRVFVSAAGKVAGELTAAVLSVDPGLGTEDDASFDDVADLYALMLNKVLSAQIDAINRLGAAGTFGPVPSAPPQTPPAASNGQVAPAPPPVPQAPVQAAPPPPGASQPAGQDQKGRELALYHQIIAEFDAVGVDKNGNLPCAYLNYYKRDRDANGFPVKNTTKAGDPMAKAKGRGVFDGVEVWLVGSRFPLGDAVTDAAMKARQLNQYPDLRTQSPQAGAAVAAVAAAFAPEGPRPEEEPF